MNRNETFLGDGDDKFLGVDERTLPGGIAKGYVARASNKRFRFGEAEDRPGCAIVPVGLDDGRTSFALPHGATVFRDPNGSEWIITAAMGKVYASTVCNAAFEVPLPAGVTLEGESVYFTQAFDTLFLWRGADAAPLRARNLSTGFEVVDDSTSLSGNGTGTLTIPNSRRAVSIQNRIVTLAGRDGAYVSDAFNYSRYSLLNAFRINQGTEDDLLALAKFGEQGLIAFKGRSVLSITNLVPDRNGDWSFAVLEDVTTSHGLAAPDAVVQAGADLYYFATNGLTSVKLTAQNKLQSRDVPLGELMPVTMGRINWAFAHLAQLAYWDNKLYLAVPLDGSEVCNGVMVYDTQQNAWQGVDEGRAFSWGVLRFAKVKYAGKERLLFLGHDGLWRLYEHGFEDDMQGQLRLTEAGGIRLTERGLPRMTEDPAIAPVPVASSVTSRGYLCGVDARKRFYNVRPLVSTWNPTFTVAANVEGAFEAETLIAAVTKDRTGFTTFGGGTFDPTDPADDPNAPYRADYSIDATSGAYFTDVNPDQHQDDEEPLRLFGRGRWCQVTITNTLGRCNLRALSLQAALADRSLLARN